MRTVLALALLVACGGDKDDDGVVPREDTAPTTTDTETDTGTPTPTVPGLCDPLPAAAGATVLSPSDDLAAAILAASAGDTLSLEAGTYTVSAPVALDRAITIRSSTDDPTAVTIDMAYASGDLFVVSASDVTLAHLTLTRSGDALVRTAPTATITGLRLHDVRLIDPAGIAVVIEPDLTETFFVDDGELSCSHLELTNTGREEVLGLCSTGGIDGRFARGWTVRDTTIDGFWCERGLPAPGIRFTRGARDTVIERNTLLDSPTGIVLGETPDQLGRRYSDDPCGDVFAQSIDGRIVNNIVSAWRDALVFDSFEGVSAGIRAESSCNVRILHNTVAHRVEPRSGASIEHRFELTTGMVGNNFTSHAVVRSDDSNAETDTNIERASELNWFFPTQDDFHLAPAATVPIDAGSTAFLTEVPTDIDGEPRGEAPDVGADERL